MKTCAPAVLVTLLIQLGCGGGGGGAGGGSGGGGGGGGSSGGPTITAQPQDASVFTGAAASFTVVATGTGALSYQWRRNGTAITGATTSTLTLAPAPGDSGATFQVVVTDASGSTTSRAATLTVTPPRYHGLALGQGWTCGLAVDGSMYCWGAGLAMDPQHPGQAVTRPRRLPIDVKFSLIGANGQDACGLSTDGHAYCWGQNAFGQVGNGTTGGLIVTPTAVAGGLSFTTLSVGGDTVCGLATGGAAYCWGLGNLGQIGNGMVDDAHVPTAVSGGLSFTSISTGQAHVCALTSTGQAYCWGSGASGVLGNGDFQNHSAPVAVSGGLAFSTIAAGAASTCGLTGAGTAYCWGSASQGALGVGPPGQGSYSTPIAVAGGYSFRSLVIGFSAACGVQASPPGGNSATFCWGANTEGLQLGSGSTDDALTPTPVAGTTAFDTVQLADELAPYQHGCGLDSTGLVSCWGWNSQSWELGDGTQTDRLVPSAVVDP